MSEETDLARSVMARLDKLAEAMARDFHATHAQRFATRVTPEEQAECADHLRVMQDKINEMYAAVNAPMSVTCDHVDDEAFDPVPVTPYERLLLAEHHLKLTKRRAIGTLSRVSAALGESTQNHDTFEGRIEHALNGARGMQYVATKATDHLRAALADAHEATREATSAPREGG